MQHIKTNTALDHLRTTQEKLNYIHQHEATFKFRRSNTPTAQQAYYIASLPAFSKDKD